MNIYKYIMLRPGTHTLGLEQLYGSFFFIAPGKASRENARQTAKPLNRCQTAEPLSEEGLEASVRQFGGEGASVWQFGRWVGVGEASESQFGSLAGRWGNS